MKASVKKIKDCRLKITVEVPAEEVEARYAEVLGSIAREATVPGFRQGKAPAEMIEKKYSKEAEEETVKSLVPEAYHRAIVNEKLVPVALPAISEISYQRGKKLTFTAEFDSAPEFQLKNYKGIKLKKVGAEVEADDVQKGLDSLRESRAELVPIAIARPVQKGDFIVSDVDIWENGAYKPGRKGIVLYAEPTEGDDFFEKVIGAQIDEVREIQADMSPEEKAQGLVGRKPAYKVWVRAIQEKKLPELDEAFAQSFGVESVDALREAIRKDVARHKAGESRRKMKDELFDKLLGMVNFPLPEGLVQKQEERLVDQARTQMQRMGVPAAKLEGELAGVRADAGKKAAEQVKLYFILQKVADQEGLDADEMEVEKRLQAIADESQRPLDEVRQVFEEDLRESLREQATIDFLLANANFQDKQA